jgi:transmembrane sensor
MTIEQNFSRLVERYQQGKLSKEKRILVDDFFGAIANQEDVNGPPPRTDLDKLILKTKILHQIDRDDKNKSLEGGKTRRFVIWFRAAATVFILASSYFAWQWHQPVKHDSAMHRKYSRANEIVKVILSDGSIVWLKGNSSLNYPEEFENNRRKVTLEGDAVFEVTKNPERPFVIKFEGLTAQVLGTSFGISSDRGKTELTVLTGRVLLSSEEDDLLVMPHEKATYDRQHKHLTKEVIKKRDEASIINGTEYNMHFDDTQMRDILTQIEKKFDVHINLSDPRIYNCVLTADLTDQSLERTMSIIAQTLRCKYEVKDHKIFIQGNGCE